MTAENKSVILQSRAAASNSSCANVGLTCPFSMRFNVERDNPVMCASSRSVRAHAVRCCHSRILIMRLV